MAQPVVLHTPAAADKQIDVTPPQAHTRPLNDTERGQLLRAVQLQYWLGLPMELPVALCMQAASADWPNGEPQERDIEQWRLAWERCSIEQAPAHEPFRLVAQARKNMQASVQRLQLAWRQHAACAQMALQQPAQAATCLQRALGQAPSAEEMQWLLAQQGGARSPQPGR